ncbi:MAG: hypothetical protein JWL77_4839 [Chthonomonadaceae bacterium]|nr:hypothetical protein [Chthonomonadaceae bacterium]
MQQDWAFAQQGHGVTVRTARGDVFVLEFNEFLGRIASGRIGPDDVVVSQVMTDGVHRRVGDLKLYAQVVSGQVRTDDLPRRVPGGVLATGLEVGDEVHSSYPLHPMLTARPSVGLLNAGLIVGWVLALLGFSLFCAVRPGTPGTHPTAPAHYRPASHPEHPPWLPH